MFDYQQPYFKYHFSFFKEEIAHLGIAVERYVPPSEVKRPVQHYAPVPFEKSPSGRVLVALQQAEQWEYGADIAAMAKVPKKGLTNHFEKLKGMGHVIDFRRSRKGKEYRLAPFILI